jgi:hypothetical protein
MKRLTERISKQSLIGIFLFLISFLSIEIASKSYKQLTYILLIDSSFFFFSIGLSLFFFIAVLELINAEWSKHIHALIIHSTKIIIFSSYLILLLFLVFISEIIFGTNKINFLISYQSAYFNTSFILIRTIILFVVWISISYLTNVKKTNNEHNKYFKYPAFYIILYLFTITITSIDFFYIFHPEWFNPVIGIYTFALSFPSCLSLITLMIIIISKEKEYFNNDHIILKNLGKLIFAFSIFWAYIAISQILIIKYANIKEEINFINLVIEKDWIIISITVFILKFIIPFFFLLSKRAKFSKIALWISCTSIILGTFVEILLISMHKYFEPIVIIYPVLFILLNLIYFGLIIHNRSKVKTKKTKPQLLFEGEGSSSL